MFPVLRYFWTSAFAVVYLICKTLDAFLTLRFYSVTNWTKAFLVVLLIES